MYRPAIGCRDTTRTNRNNLTDTICMRDQDVVTIFLDPSTSGGVKTSAEHDEWFNNGMYMESHSQPGSQNSGNACMTLVHRYYNTSTFRGPILTPG